MLISFSGLDGAGKTTQIKMLLNSFNEMGYLTGSVYELYPDIRYHSIQDLKNLQIFLEKYDVIHLRFRLNSDENNKIMNTLEYSDFSTPYIAQTVALQGYFDHIRLYRYVVFPLLEKGKTIISDRHYYDEVAFKCAYGCSYSYMMNMYTDCYKPDIAFYIFVSPETVFCRNINRPDGKTTLYQDITHIIKLNDIFKQLLIDTELIKINGNHSCNDIHKNILCTLTDTLDINFPN